MLNSDLISHAAADRVDASDNPQAIARSVQIVASPASDVVTITASAPTAERARDIAQAVVDAYFEQLQTQLDSVQGRESVALEEQVSALEEQLDAVDAEIETVLKPFLPSGEISGNGNYPPLPTADQVAPNLVSTKQNLLAEYQQLVSTRTQLETAGQLQDHQPDHPARLAFDRASGDEQQYAACSRTRWAVSESALQQQSSPRDCRRGRLTTKRSKSCSVSDRAVSFPTRRRSGRTDEWPSRRCQRPSSRSSKWSAFAARRWSNRAAPSPWRSSAPNARLERPRSPPPWPRSSGAPDPRCSSSTPTCGHPNSVLCTRAR